jgi:hypothetical protein
MSAEHATTVAAQLSDADLLNIVGPIAVHCSRTGVGGVPRPGLPHLAPGPGARTSTAARHGTRRGVGARLRTAHGVHTLQFSGAAPRNTLDPPRENR